MLSLRSLNLSSFLFVLFFFILSHGSDFHYSMYLQLTICSSASFLLLLIPSSEFFHSSYCSFLFFISSSSLLKISCIFLGCVSIIFLRFWTIFLLWILFQLDCLSPLHLVVLLGLYLVLSSGTYFSFVSFCPSYCDCSFCSTGWRVVKSVKVAVAWWNLDLLLLVIIYTGSG